MGIAGGVVVVLVGTGEQYRCLETEAPSGYIRAVADYDPFDDWAMTLPGYQYGIRPSGAAWSDEPLVLINHDPHGAVFERAASMEDGASAILDTWELPYKSTESSPRESGLGPWVEDVATRFREILALSDNWDGHGARKIRLAHIRAAARFLVTVMASSTPAPAIVPTSEGGLQLEWHRAGLDVEVLFGDDEEPPLLFVGEVSSDREWEGPLVEGFAEFELADRLRG